MARLQVLHLPAPEGEHPFALVLDEWDADSPLGPAAVQQLERGGLAIGARGVLVFQQRVDVE